MKPLLAILFLFALSNAEGQVFYHLSDPPEHCDTCFGKIEWHFAPYTGTVDSEFSAYVLSIVEKAYSRYEKDCWNDSTKGFVTIGPCVDTVNNIYRFTQDWVHNHHPSFPGFIEWLRKQQ